MPIPARPRTALAALLLAASALPAAAQSTRSLAERLDSLAGSGVLPGGPIVGIVGWLGLAALVLALFTAAGRWSPKTGWLGAFRGVPAAVRDDPAGAAYLVATGVFAAVVTWQLVPLVIPALGCIALAIVAVPERPRRPRPEDE